MPKYKIFAGLAGGFGGASLVEVKDFNSEEDAAVCAYEYAVQEYESYEGLHGLRDLDQIMEEDEVNEDEAYEIYQSEREGWLDYWVELVPDNYDPKKDPDHEDYDGNDDEDDEEDKVKIFTITYTTLDSYSIPARSEEEALEKFHHIVSDVFEVENIEENEDE